MLGTSFKIEGDKLIITCDISKAAVQAAQPSKSSGKKLIVATSGSAQAVGAFTVALNVMAPNTAWVKPA